MRIILALALLAGAWQSASAAGIESCEKIKDADAYNSCLASFGPAAGAHAVTRPSPAEGLSAAPRRHGRKSDAPKRAAKRQAKRPAKGRVRIEIYPGK